MRLPLPSRAVAAASLLPVLLMASAPARGTVADEVAAQALFEQGRALMASGEFEQACPKLEESQRLAPGLGTSFNLADCYSHVGRPASAWSLFRDVEAQAKLASQVARMQVARRRADELEPLLPRLVVRVRPRSGELDVRRDGVPIGSAQWDTALPVDVGAHVISAAAPGKRAWRAIVQVVRPGEVITVLVPDLEPEPGSSSHLPGSPSVPPWLDRAPAPRARSRTAAVVCGAAGLALLAASGASVALARARYHDASPCSGAVCYTEQAVTQRRHALVLGNIGTGLAIAGGVGVAAGAVLWIATSKSSATSGPRGVSWRVGVSGGGLMAGAAW
jgi:hypothetical protein